MLVGNTKKLDVVIPTVVPKIGKRLHTKSSQFPDTWRTYKRLVNPNQPVPRLREKYVNKGCLLDIPTVDVPSKDGLKCTCFENVVHAVREVCCYTPPMMNRLMKNQQTHRWMKETKSLVKENERYQRPLATLNVRWQLKRILPGYDLSSLYNIFSRHGEIKDLRMTSPNSAMVVFDELSVACNVANSRFLGDPQNRLHCRFWHRTMENKAVVLTQKGSCKVKPIPFL
ncbi:testis expressed protein 56-like [Mytilus galloprovincialis]|uniref:testis expressed protein 56-like n=1 Tax=Mytilus galloprovincialis TaxID=29158 RepID=UPI003F7B7FF5